jgi:hypothetical protein
MSITSTSPRSGSISAAVQYSGVGRSSLYLLAAKHAGLFRKLGSKTIVDFRILDQIIDGLPTGVSEPQPQLVRARRKRTA